MDFISPRIMMFAGAFVLLLIVQAYLSSRPQKVWGFLLPIASFAFSIYAIIYFKNFVGNHGFEGYHVWGWYALQVFTANLPTFILLLIRSLFRRH